MNLEQKMAEIFEIILDEMKTNPSFAEKLAGILIEEKPEKLNESIPFDQEDGQELSLQQESAELPVPEQAGIEEVGEKKGKSSDKSSTRRKRNPAKFNPETILIDQGKEALQHQLETLEVIELKDIISEFGMDPAKKTTRWRKKERFVDHILDVALNQIEKGNAFRR